MKFYDYEQVPLHVADEAFAEFMQDWEKKTIFDLLDELVWHCDRWCKQQGAFSEQDNRVAVVNKLQAYLHEKYSEELAMLMRANITKYQQNRAIKDRLYERRN